MILNKIISKFKKTNDNEEDTLNYFFKKVIARKTGFDREKIILIFASRKNDLGFNYFEFKYNNLNYILYDNKLSINSSNLG